MPKRKLLVKCIALDAMGVIFRVGDDVKDLLYPFIIEKGGTEDFTHVREVYLKASLGEITAEDFWRTVGLDGALEDEYLGRHKLSEGLLEILQKTQNLEAKVWCLSNDLAEWSQKLRCNFGLNNYLAGAVISGEVGFRKPDPAIYYALLQRSGYKAAEILFVDDNVRNVDAAAALNLQTVLFDPLHCSFNSGHRAVSSFDELQKMIFCP